MYSDSYSICFWINPDKRLITGNAVEIAHTELCSITGKHLYLRSVLDTLRLMSLMPISGHGDMFFRIKDDREPNEWHDIMCRPAVPGQWSYICATYDVITHIGKLYFNGLLVGSRENMPKTLLRRFTFYHRFPDRTACFETA